MVILGISSATKIITAALIEDGKLLSEITVSGKEAFTENLILYVEKLVEESEKKIDGIAVVVGPGAYSGLRGGLATAKTLAQVKGLKLAAVSTLHALAFNLQNITGTIAAITDACQDDYNFALFRSNENKIDRITDDLVLHFDRLTEFLGQVKGELHLVGATEEIMAKVREVNPQTKIVVARTNAVSGYNVALIGEELIKEGKTEDPIKLAPKYSHTPNIREFKA